MTHPHLSRLATEILREDELRAEQSAPADDARAIDAIEHAIAASRGKRRIHRAATLASLALVATAILGVGWRLRSHPSAGAETASAPTGASQPVAALGHALSDGVVLMRDGREVALGSGTALAPRDRVVTSASGRLAISLASGTHLVVGTSSDFAITEQGLTLAFALSAGTLSADVARLGTGERFVVRTLDGEVEVRGTSFQVRIVDPSSTCGAGTRTRVVVTEGTVVVRAFGREDSVHKGESWPPDCAAPAASGALIPTPLVASASASAAPPSSDVALGARKSTSKGLPAPVVVVGAPPPESDLAAQNALFAEASAARRRGDGATALAAYERFLEQHPGSQLAESAYVERMRLLAAASDPRRGAEAARAYLARYPRGFARGEATDLAANGR
jgi:ferric-dicitrate binding protein FerR (iron transport regulator)